MSPSPTYVRRIRSLNSIVYDDDAQLYFNQLVGQPSNDFKSAINTLVIRLKTDGNWTPLYRLVIHATEIQQHARVSLANPSSTQILEVNSPTWTVNQGYTGNGSSMYLNTNFNPFVSMSINDTCIGNYITTNLDEPTGVAMGCEAAAAFHYYPRLSNNYWYFLCQNTNAFTANVSSLGLFSIRRTASNATAAFKNGTSLATSASASVSIPNGSMYILATHTTSTGLPSALSSRRIAISFMATSGLDQSLFNSAIQAFATTRGFNV